MSRRRDRWVLAARSLVGAALVAAVGAAGTAWACTPTPSLNVNDAVGDPLSGPPGSKVVLTATYPVTVPQTYFEGDTLVLEDIGNGVMVETPIPASGEVKLLHTIFPAASRWNYFHSYVKGQDGSVIVSSQRWATYQVAQDVAVDDDPVPEPPVTTVEGPVQEIAPGQAPPAVEPAQPAQPSGAAPADRPEPVAGAPAVRAPASAPVAGRVDRPAVPGGAEAPGTVASPAGRAPVPSAQPGEGMLQLPRSADLWSAVDPSAQAAGLLGEASQPADGRPNPGGVLLGLGLLAILAVAAGAARRQLVNARS